MADERTPGERTTAKARDVLDDTVVVDGTPKQLRDLTAEELRQARPARGELAERLDEEL